MPYNIGSYYHTSCLRCGTTIGLYEKNGGRSTNELCRLCKENDFSKALQEQVLILGKELAEVASRKNGHDVEIRISSKHGNVEIKTDRRCLESAEIKLLIKQAQTLVQSIRDADGTPKAIKESSGLDYSRAEGCVREDT